MDIDINGEREIVIRKRKKRKEEKEIWCLIDVEKIFQRILPVHKQNSNAGVMDFYQTETRSMNLSKIYKNSRKQCKSSGGGISMVVKSRDCTMKVPIGWKKNGHETSRTL
ncbi:hypothetical protein TWF225_010056 [Orbilia oligospora]|nr:hypothetical protein TWF225_010056 [Orbilia oligospora]KAF3243292.1 hypothetical protein TWF128_010269 [Orbilia oligospora]KAF3250896.1 hypothetical protein TWF217_008505 [Orbilia oligospora]